MLRWRTCGRRLYAENGRFEIGNLQDWQHSAMYAAFLLSGVVDLLGWGLQDALPDGSEHVRHLLLMQVVLTCPSCPSGRAHA